MTKQNQTLVGFVIALIVIGGGSFYGGMQYQKSKTPSFAGGFNRAGMMQGAYGGASGGTRGAGRVANGGFASGDVLSKDDKSITIKLRTGGSEIILLSDKTQVVKADQGAVSDISVGQALTLTGTPNSDGSLTAESIQIRPAVPAQTTPTTKTN